MAVSEITEEHYAAPAPAIDGETVRQAGRFLAVGAVGYAVNLAAYAGALHGLALDYRASAVLAFTLALLTTFVLNRRYTFAAADGPTLLNDTVPLTGAPADAVAGSESVVVTSAIDVIVVVSEAVSGSVFEPWLVAVAIDDDTVTAPSDGAV